MLSYIIIIVILELNLGGRMETLPESIKSLRLEKKLTLKELGLKTDLSVSFLSQIERGESSPAITSLNRIAEALDVHITHFFTPTIVEDYKISFQQVEPYRMEHSSQLFYRMSSNFENRELENYIIEIPAGERNEKMKHSGEEMYYIIEGEITVCVNNEAYALQTHDVIHFPSHISHYYENHTKKTSKILCVVTQKLF